MVNTGSYIKTIPPEVSAFCNAQDFPLLVVPWRVHMATIMRRFSQALLHSEQEQTEWTSAVKNMIFRPQEESLYRPALESRGLQSEWPYCVTLLEPAEPAFYEDLGVYRLLMSVEDQELREYTAAILDPLQTTDATGGTTYMDFLRIWLGCGCSTQRTAEQLFLHRNTVEYHLHRIGALLHMDMSELNVRLQLSLAPKILDMG